MCCNERGRVTKPSMTLSLSQRVGLSQLQSSSGKTRRQCVRTPPIVSLYGCCGFAPVSLSYSFSRGLWPEGQRESMQEASHYFMAFLYLFIKSRAPGASQREPAGKGGIPRFCFRLDRHIGIFPKGNGYGIASIAVGLYAGVET